MSQKRLQSFKGQKESRGLTVDVWTLHFSDEYSNSESCYCLNPLVESAKRDLFLHVLERQSNALVEEKEEEELVHLSTKNVLSG
mmetsp:Transcript_30002/g.69979  ORF Transcript_30002/g.69979 Transcript_30002/m.69979 type:complete len:84 (+) Transcript_30002:119-370(+)